MVEAAGGEKVYTEGKDGSPVMCKQELESGLLSFFGFDPESTKDVPLALALSGRELEQIYNFVDESGFKVRIQMSNPPCIGDDLSVTF